MFTFLNSLLLFALPAALLPLLIHLFTRQKIKTVLFSSLTFLKVLQRQRMRLIKLYQWLLLLIRTLVVLLAILVFARPALKGAFSAGIGSRAATTAVIVLDNSFSMGADSPDGILFDVARRRVHDILRVLKPDDRAHLIICNEDIPFINEEATHNFKWLADVADKTVPSARGTDLGKAVAAAARLAGRAQTVNREVFLISDFTRQGWPVSAVSDSSAESGIVWYCVRVTGGRAVENMSVRTAALDNQIIAAGQPVTVRVVVANHTGHADEVQIRLRLQDRRVNETSLSVGADKERSVILPAQLETPGWYGGSVRIGDDPLALDNVRWFGFPVPDRIRVLVVSPGASGGQEDPARYIRYALTPRNGTRSSLAVEEIPSGDLLKRQLDSYQAVVLVDPPVLTGTERSSLARFYREGGTLVVFAGDHTDVRNMNGLLKSCGGLALLSRTGMPGQTDGFARFAHYVEEHPVFRGLFPDVKKIDQPKVYARYGVRVPAASRILIRLTGGEPALAEAVGKQGRLFLFPFSPEPAWTDYSRKGSFVPTVYRIIQYAGSRLTSPEDMTYCGEVFSGAFRELAGIERVAVRNPQGEVYTVPVTTRQGMPAIRFEDTRVPGLYTVISGKKEVAGFAVNCRTEESDLTPLEDNALRQGIGRARIRVVENGENMETVVRDSRHGKEIASQLLWLLCGLLAAEMIIARKRKYVKG